MKERGEQWTKDEGINEWSNELNDVRRKETTKGGKKERKKNEWLNEEKVNE
jgi:hypothetical protein